MIRSMTGYGRARQGDLTVEVRAVNHRYLDVSVRTPRVLSFLEGPVSKLVAGAARRGKVEVSLSVDNLAAQTTKLQFNRDILEGYLDVAQALEDEYGLQDDLAASGVMRLPDVMVTVRQELDTAAMTAQVSEITEKALAEFTAARVREGAHLAANIEEKLTVIEDLTGQIERRMPETVAAYREKLLARMQEILENRQIEETRILQEAALYADRVSVDEETVRLRGHIAALRGMLETPGAIGRKMDFLVQEFGREANTIGSKCSDTEASRLVIDLKAEIEKIREQVQNIE